MCCSNMDEERGNQKGKVIPVDLDNIKGMKFLIPMCI